MSVIRTPRPWLSRVGLALCALGLVALAPAGDSPTLSQCQNGFCTQRMTGPELLSTTEKLVLARKFDEAKPLLAALRQAPELSLETNFLEGYVAVESGQLGQAAKSFRAVLAQRPDMVRARLELARVLLMDGKEAAADHHFRLAEEAADLPVEIEQTIRDSRSIIRGRKNWSLNVSVGLAPDSNINSATDAETINLNFGGYALPFALSPDARRRTGIGQTASAGGSVRLRLDNGLAMLVDGNGSVVNYKGKDADDVSALLAAGPEVTLKTTRIAAQAVASKRWYGGRAVQRQLGGRVTVQQMLAKGQRLDVQFDLRDTKTPINSAYSGTSLFGYASYERVVRKSMIASVAMFGRREKLADPGYSNKEIGGNVGIGGELPMGINGGLSAGISRAIFEGPTIFSQDPRRDWRYNARAYLGMRSVRVLGFSPEVTYSFSKVNSNLPIYTNQRHRVEFALARYF